MNIGTARCGLQEGHTSHCLEREVLMQKNCLFSGIANRSLLCWLQVGALGKAKDVLREVVQLPLQQPALFAKGSLARPTKGILLFGPPGIAQQACPWPEDQHMPSSLYQLQSSVLCRAGTITCEAVALMICFKEIKQDVNGKAGLLYYALP